ncbi:MAG: hypothetical protein M1274_11215 [Actinobacteria bacterium]|nr:hypothetical protein [Actinomycetota bacterium]
MRAIVNLMSGNISKATGWRAREVRVDKPGATLEDVFRQVILRDGVTNLFELVSEQQGLKPEYALYVGGELLRGDCNWRRSIIGSEQIHVADWPIIDS